MASFDRVVDAGKSFACGLYRLQPGALIPNPISDLLHLAWDNLCGDDGGGLPSPPSTPFQGGQCVDARYGVYADIITGSVRSPTYTSVFGPVGGSRAVITPDGPSSFRATYQIFCKGTRSVITPAPRPLGWYDVGSNPSQPPDTRFEITAVEREDGQPDNCGNLPPQFPPAPPPPPGGYTSSPTIINYNDGSDFTAIFNLQPPTNTDKGPPDICLSVDIKGVVFKVCFPPDKLPNINRDGGDIGDLLKEIQNDLNTLQEDINNINIDIDDLSDDVDNFHNEYRKDKNPPSPDDDPDLNKDPLPGDKGGEDENTPGLKWVVVSLTKLPEKAQFGTPTVFFGGWVTFNIGGAYTVREQINFERGIFPAPPGATGYGVTFTNQAEGQVVAYVESTSPPGGL